MLLSRTHNEFLIKELDLFVNYSTKGVIKSTYLDKDDSPVFLQIDRKHGQQVNYPITLVPKEEILMKWYCLKKDNRPICIVLNLKVIQPLIRLKDLPIKLFV
jgi:hypothetical protein